MYELTIKTNDFNEVVEKIREFLKKHAKYYVLYQSNVKDYSLKRIEKNKEKVKQYILQKYRNQEKVHSLFEIQKQCKVSYLFLKNHLKEIIAELEAEYQDIKLFLCFCRTRDNEFKNL